MSPAHEGGQTNGEHVMGQVSPVVFVGHEVGHVHVPRNRVFLESSHVSASFKRFGRLLISLELVETQRAEIETVLSSIG